MSLIKRLLRHRSALVGGCLIALMGLAALVAPFAAPYEPTNRAGKALSPPSLHHPMGSDEMGRDLFSRVLYGARLSLLVGVVAVGIGLLLGLAIGLAAGYLSGVWDNLLMRLMDMMLAFPAILLAIVIVAVLGPTLVNAMISVGIVAVPTYARIARASVLAERAKDHVTAARSLGAGHLRIIALAILPNILAPLTVQATLGFGTAILDAAGLSFLGLGAQPPVIEWGLLLKSGRELVWVAWWVVTFPGLMILVSVLGFNLLGDGLRDVLDPRLRKR